MDENYPNLEQSAGALTKAVNLGKELRELKTIEIGPNEKNVLSLIPEGMKVISLADHMPPEPDRKRLKTVLYDIKDFIDYVNEHKEPATRIFASTLEDPYRFVGVIDFHEPKPEGHPSWITHKACLRMTMTDEWKTWYGHNTKPFGQEEFAEFLEDNQIYIVAPSGGEILDIASNLEATKSSSFKKALRLDNGDTEFVYNETTDASANGGSAQIPKSFTLQLTPFVGVDPSKIEARFRYRIREGRLSMSYHLVRPKVLIQEVVQNAIEVIKKETNLPVYQGGFD